MTLTAGAVIFYALAALVLASAAVVAFSRNILHSGFALLGTLAGMAGLYLWLGADFVGIVQLVVYVGGILVLILFAVLLTNRIADVKVSNLALDRFGVAVPVVTGFAGLVWLLVAHPWQRVEGVAVPTTARLGDAFLREYLLPFEVISLVLLMALVGAMVIARRAAREEHQDPDARHDRLV